MQCYAICYAHHSNFVDFSEQAKTSFATATVIRGENTKSNPLSTFLLFFPEHLRTLWQIPFNRPKIDAATRAMRYSSYALLSFNIYKYTHF